MQLVGVGALFIATKYEEISCPLIDDFVWISADAFKREDIVRVEKAILETIGFDLSTQTPIHFLRRFSKAARSNTRTHTLSKYLIEVSLMDYGMLKHLPSLIAASAVYLARKMTDIEPLWVHSFFPRCKRALNKPFPQRHPRWSITPSTARRRCSSVRSSLIGVCTTSPTTTSRRPS
jgi:hypothetical protein